jgi:hypothetical protein
MRCGMEHGSVEDSWGVGDQRAALPGEGELSADALPGKPLPVALRAAKGAERSGSIMRY